ncbi:MAG: hypothetical protein KHX01_02955 [Eggerthella sp.]|nr:hypothetical protein [Eggerthella sp.]
MKTTQRTNLHHIARAFLSIAIALIMVISLIPSSAGATGSEQTDETTATPAAVNTDETPEANAPAPETDAPSAGTESAAPEASAPAENEAPTPENAKTTEPAHAAAADPQARIGNTTYATVPEAVEAAQDGDTITLLADANLTGAGTLTISNKTLDLNGHSISADNFTLVFQGDNATIRNGSFVGTNRAAYGLFFGDSMTSHNATLEDMDITGGINIFNTASVTLRNVTADASANNSPYYAIWIDVNANATVESGNFTSNGAAVIGLTNKAADNPVSSLSVQGGNFYSSSSPLVLGGDRYAPVISGGSYFTADVQNYLAANCCIMPSSDGRFSVVKQNDTVQLENEKTLPSNLQLIALDTTDAQRESIDHYAQTPDIKAQLDKAGGIEHLWTVNIILRDKATLEEQHQIETSFVIAYPAGFDAQHYQDYTFAVLHLQTIDEGDIKTVEPVVIPEDHIDAQADGLHITSTLSPFAISYGLTSNAEKPQPTPNVSDTPDTPNTTPTTPGTTEPTHPVVVPDNGTSNETKTETSIPGAIPANTPATNTQSASAPALSANEIVNDGENLEVAIDHVAEIPLANALGREHIGHEAAAFLVDPLWYFETVNELWVALFGLGALAILAIGAGIVIARRNRKNMR